MYQKIINDYLNKLTINDIISYAKDKENTIISEKDATILLQVAKENYQKLLNNEEKDVFSKLKKELDYETYKLAYKLYIKAKIKYLK